MEPGHGNGDRIGNWHYGHGNYAAIDGSISTVSPLVAGNLNPTLNDWWIKAPSGNLIQVGQDKGYGTWKNR